METNTLLRVVVRRTRVSIRQHQFTTGQISLKSQGVTRKRTAKSLWIACLSLNSLRLCASGCGNPQNGAAVSMAGNKMELVFLLRTPGCQVDHTPE